MDVYRLIIIWFGKLLLTVTRWRGGGSALPGLVVEKMAPRFLERCAGDFDMTVLVAGTNGKTTTTKMIRHILEEDGHHVLTNAAGSNMPRGIISAVLARMDWQGHIETDVGLFEVDEGFLEGLAEVFQPRAVLALNLLRDQLDRYGELNRTAQLIADALPHADTAILNADDPRVAELEEYANKAIFFGADEHVRQQVPHDDNLHAGKVKNTNKPSKNMAVKVMSAERSDTGQQLSLAVGDDTWAVDLKIAGVFNAYNAAASVALAHLMDIPKETTVRALGDVEPAFGRSERIQIGNKQVLLLLVKNPSGFNQIINTYISENEQTPTLIAINDNHADGRDVSWLWDVNIEQLESTKKPFITSGVRGYDMALRLQYGEIQSTTELKTKEAIDMLLSDIPEGGEGHIVPTYTAMWEIRKLLSKYATISEKGE